MFNSIKKVLAGMAALAALGLGGAAFAGAASSSTTTSATTSQPSQSAPSHQSPRAFNGPAPGSTAHEDAEKTVTGSDAAKAQAAAVKSVGSGTAGPVTTNYTGDGYETTVTKSDGSNVQVHLDSSFNAMDGPGGPGGPPAGAGSGA